MNAIKPETHLKSNKQSAQETRALPDEASRKEVSSPVVEKQKALKKRKSALDPVVSEQKGGSLQIQRSSGILPPPRKASVILPPHVAKSSSTGIDT